MGMRDLPDMYAQKPEGWGHTYQANPECPCYKWYVTLHAWVILKPTIKSYMSHYISNWAISDVSTQRMHQRDQRNNSPRLHSDVHWCTFRCSPGELFVWSFWYALWYILGMLKKQGYMAYVSLWIPLIWGVKVLHSNVYILILKLF